MPSSSYILYILCVNFLILGIFGQSQCFTPNTGTTLTFYAGAQTTSAKSSPISQLICNGGNGCKYSSEVETVQCSCTGIDDFQNPQWKCQSDLPDDLRLGKVLVSCESCTTASDPQMLTGSCGLYYNLNYNADGDFDDQHDESTDDGALANFLLGFFEIIFIVVLAIIVIAGFVACCKWANNEYRYERLPLRHDSFREVEAIATPIKTNPVPSAPPVQTRHVYQQPVVQQIQPIRQVQPVQQVQPVYTSYQNPPRQDNSSFVNGMIVGEMVGGKKHGNHLAEDMLLMNAMSGSSSGNNFTTGLLLGEAMSSNNRHHTSAPVHHKPPVHHAPAPAPSHHGGNHGGHHSVSTGFGGTMRR